jgi:hypothetical protein
MRFNKVEITNAKDKRVASTQLPRFGVAVAIFIACLNVISTAQANSPDWDEYDGLLKTYVVSGTTAGVALNQVDYGRLAQDPAFSQQVQNLANFRTHELQDRDETLAFYINAYNILALKIVIENLPLESIKDVGNFFRPVWKREAGVIGGKPVSLHEIEHDVLRKMNDPRIHFAIVCASVSCPDLRMEAYRAEKLHDQLDSQSRDFLLNSKKGLRLGDENADISQIFKWFDKDFAGHGGVEGFIRRYYPLPNGVRLRITIDYNWSLNARRVQEYRLLESR